MWTEQARAKVNLTLAVHGRRPDGYHELSSLVVFADVGDRLTLTPGPGFALTASGPHAGAIDGENLIARAVRRLGEARPGLALGTFHLHKILPVASGIGGGSADAAAALRLVAAANPGEVEAGLLATFASLLGADVPVCLAGRTAWMTGVGAPLPYAKALPALAAVLVNPGVKVATADVFRRLAAPPLPAGFTPPAPPRAAATAGELIDLVAAGRNDLEPPALALAPEIGEALAALRAVPGCRLARMSGSGATCFGLFASDLGAIAAAAILKARHLGWWITSCRLG